MQSDPLTDLGRPPGRLVDIGEFRLHVWSQGTGRPPVVLEAGTWEVSLAWAWILPEVAKSVWTPGWHRLSAERRARDPHERFLTPFFKGLLP